MREDVKVLNGRAKLYAGLHLQHVRQYNIKQVVDICIKNGADGVCFFTGNSLKDEDWDTFSQTIDGLELNLNIIS